MNNQQEVLVLFGALIGALSVSLFVFILLSNGVRRTFYRFKKFGPHLRWYDFAYSNFGDGGRIREFVLNAIAEGEFRTGIYLTRSARELLIIPIEEAFEDPTIKFDFGAARESIFLLMDAMQHAESFKDTPSQRPLRQHNSQSVVRAFHQRFCKIPPFCDGRGE